MSSTKPAKPIGSPSRPGALTRLDGRSREARLLRDTRAELAAHVGGKPSATQTALITRAAMLTLYLARMDAKAMETGAMSDHATREYLAWSNTLTRTMRQLGLKGIAEKAPSLSEIIAGRKP